jgi:hypothetical protein
VDSFTFIYLILHPTVRYVPYLVLNALWRIPAIGAINESKAQGIHKRMVRLQSLIKDDFLPYTDTTYTVSSGNCRIFLCATSSSPLMLTAGPVSKMASQQERAFCVLRLEVSRSVIAVQPEFSEQFEKVAPYKNNIFFLR